MWSQTHLAAALGAGGPAGSQGLGGAVALEEGAAAQGAYQLRLHAQLGQHGDQQRIDLR